MNGNYRIFLKKIKMYPLNITFFHRFLYRINTSSTKTLFLHESLTGTKTKNIYFFPDLSWMYEKLLAFKKNKTHLIFNVKKNFVFLGNPNFKKENFKYIYVLQEMINYFFHTDAQKLFLIQWFITYCDCI